MGRTVAFLINYVILVQAVPRWAVGCFREKGDVNGKWKDCIEQL